MCWSGAATFCMSIGVAKYDMVVVSKPSMAVVRIGQGWAHSRGRRVGDRQTAADGGETRGRQQWWAWRQTTVVRHAWWPSAWRKLGCWGAGVDSGEGVRLELGCVLARDGKWPPWNTGDVADAGAAEGAQPAERAHQTILL
jgi:hypothetical protein